MGWPETIITVALALCWCPAVVADSSSQGPPRGGWEKIPDDSGVEDENVTVLFGLEINFDHQAFRDMFDPKHTNYRKFHSLEESRQKATADLEACGEKFRSEVEGLGLMISEMTKYREYYRVSGSAGDMLGLFQNETLSLKRFVHEHANRTIVRAVFNQEADVVDLIDNVELRLCVGLVLGLVNFPLVRRPPVRKAVPPLEEGRGRDLATCSAYDSPSFITPQTLFQMYKVPSTPVGATPMGTVQAVYEGTSVLISEQDLQCFNSAFELAPDSLSGNYGPFNTGNCGKDSCNEPNLDVQYMSAMNQGVDVSYAAYPSIGDMVVAALSWTDSELPYVMSISWGEAESTYYGSNLRHTCKEIGTLAGRGMTFFASAGDQGATNSQPCGKNYNVNFPASCPFVTAVGATTGWQAGSEVVCNSNPSVITTGGGFSTIFNKEAGFELDFQEDQVAAYRDQISSSLEGFPSTGRGLPDVSAPGTNYVVKIDKESAAMDGTSCSSPVMAGITARIMLENNGTRFGNINYALYQNEGIFFDVVSGQNSGDGKSAYCPSGATSNFVGFEATPGWDAACGLGTLGTGDGYDSYKAILTGAALPPSTAPTPSSVGSPGLTKWHLIYACLLLAASFLSS